MSNGSRGKGQIQPGVDFLPDAGTRSRSDKAWLEEIEKELAAAFKWWEELTAVREGL